VIGKFEKNVFDVDFWMKYKSTTGCFFPLFSMNTFQTKI